MNINNVNNLNQVYCQQCLIGYYLKDSLICARLSNGCTYGNATGYCTSCYDGFNLSSNGVCYRLVAKCQTYQQLSGLCL